VHGGDLVVVVVRVRGAPLVGLRVGPVPAALVLRRRVSPRVGGVRRGLSRVGGVMLMIIMVLVMVLVVLVVLVLGWVGDAVRAAVAHCCGGGG
jgi:hypothetical protein